MTATRTRTTSGRLLAGTALTGVLLPLCLALPAAPALADDAELGDAVVSIWGDCRYADDLNFKTTQNEIAFGGGTLDGQTALAGGNALQQQVSAESEAAWFEEHAGPETQEACRGNADMDNVLRVGAGTTGLPVGAEVTLVADVYVAGGVNDTPDAEDPYVTEAMTNVGWGVTDAAGVELAELYADSYRKVEAYINPLTGASSWTFTRRYDWSVTDNTGQQEGEYSPLSGSLCTEFPCQGTPEAPEGATGRLPLPITHQRLVFTTEVGAELHISGVAQTFTQAVKTDVTASADAALDADIEPAPGFEGLALTYGDQPDGGEGEDVTAPAVAATLPDGQVWGWYREDVGVELEATDEGSGVATLSYQVGDGDWVNVDNEDPSQPARATVPVTGEGITEVRFTASDNVDNEGPVQTVTVQVDKSAPVAKAELSEPAVDGWHRAPVTVALSATDAHSGVRRMEWLVNGEPGAADAADASVQVTVPGTTVIAYRALDVAGNASPWQTVTVKLDDTAPTVTVPAPMTVPATSAAGAAVTYAVTATDGDAAVPVSCSPASGTVFPVGTTTVTCEATDAAGNTGSAQFAVTVTPPVTAPTGAQQIADLRSVVAGLPETGGVVAPLTGKLDAAAQALAAGKTRNACQHLEQFAHMTAQRSGKKIAKATAGALIASARSARTTIGC